MSPMGALTVALSSILVLGALAAWLVNIPLWAVGFYLILGTIGIGWLIRRVTRGRARQKTESEV